MSTPHPADLLARAARVRLACFDVDGTLTDGRLYYGATGEAKAFSVLDGFGLRLLEEHGIRVAIISARRGEIVAARARDLQIGHVHVGVHDKAACLRAIAAELGLDAEATSHMGDDLNDLPAMAAAGLAVAPANAHPWVLERVHWQTGARGGEGAARELCDLILEAHGLRAAVLAGIGAA